MPRTKAIPVRAAPLRIDGTMDVATAFRAVMGNALDQFDANRPAVARNAPDPEFVHQARVAIRRLRSAIRLFEKDVTPPDGLGEDLRWLGQSLGTARDLDVFVSETLPRATQEATLPEEDGPDSLATIAEACRQQARSAAAAALRGARCRRILLVLHTWRETPELHGSAARKLRRPIRRLARRALADAHARLLRRGCKSLAELRPERRHRTRIAAKRLRYIIEFMADLFPEHPAMLRRLKDLQEVLGQLNDRAVTARLLAGFPDGPARTVLMQWNQQAEAQAFSGLDRLWKRFRREQPFWN